ncbi:DUF3853 family protein [Vaginella massiliensis]|uniref:DUF3853 family protein n=1 Tax=Vaginella massiliensis TaxID=1816680 RepID=UPI000837F8F7|nr:DUF3853 family protein [Vaginella massiliensis]
MENYNKPIWQLTVGEFLELLNKNNSNNVEPPKTEKEYAYGINGLAMLLGCSKNYAWKLKSSGLFDEAIIQNGRKIIIDKEKALELFNKKS